MLFALDIGNSDVKAGLWNGKRWLKQWRRETRPVLSAESYSSSFEQMVGQVSVELPEIDCTAIASVVPEATEPAVAALSDLFKFEPLLINNAADTGIEVKTEQPQQVGADLIAGAVGAYHLAGDTCIIVDCGTATTVMTVDSSGRLLGGAICNGLKTSIDALIRGTAQLQQIPLDVPPSPVGKNTIQAMQAGLIDGHLAMIEGLVDKTMNEIGPAQVVATGGLIPVLADHTDHFDFVEPTLVLDGVRLIAERQANDS